MTASSSKITLMFQLALRNILRNKRRSSLTFVAIAVGIWSCVALSALARGVSDGMTKDAIWTLTGHIQIHEPEYLLDPVVDHRFPFDEQQFRSQLADDLVTQWAPRVRVPAVIRSERETLGVSFLGIVPSAEKGLSFIGENPKNGKHLSSRKDPGLIVGEKLAETLQTGLGKRVVIMASDINGKIADRGFRIIGIFQSELESTEKSYVFASLETAQTLLGMGNEISEISLITEEEGNLLSLVNNLKNKFPKLDVQAWNTLEPLIDAMRKIQGGFLLIWFFAVVIAISFGVINTLIMSIMERTWELGLMQALGLKPGEIRALLLIESLVWY